MFLYEEKLVIKNNSIDVEKVTYTPCEGYIIPLKFHLIEGFGKQLYQTGFLDRKRRPLNIYIYLDEDQYNYSLCLKYKNGKFRIVPKVGFQISQEEIEMLLSVITQKI
jgi:hypothetical protein